MLSEARAGDDVHFRTICLDHSWRRTTQRRAVFDYLAGNREHPSVEAVCRRVRERLPDISLDSIYRILDDFATAGLIRRLGVSKIVRYDSDTTSHGHFLCTDCGQLSDFPFPEAGRLASECRTFGKVAEVELCVRGVCRSCLDRAAETGGNNERKF
jgi:Fur family peroxide stress response transcriptional regulator